MKSEDLVMKAKGLALGACLVFAASTAANAELKIEALTPPLPLTIVGWGSFDTNSAKELEAAGIEFSNALHAGYIDLSNSRKSAPDPDFKDSEHFNHKARTAARRSSVLPDEPTDRDLSDSERGIFADAVERLRDAFDRGGREVAPQDAATAQISYDCWIEATEFEREEDAKACRGEFESALARVNQLADYALTDVEFRPRKAPMMAALPVAPEGYLVYFQWDSTDLTPAGQAALQEGIRAAEANPDTRVVLVGHADRSGAQGYNQGLSEKRALVVIQGMTSSGISRSRISWNAVGEDQPLVPTEDGVREQGNRVVEIDLM
jgi:OOP family OmpA-OmpF porin